jgi:hypothetical protein
MAAAAILGFVLLASAAAPPAQAACRQALALGLDVSGSVDAREYRLQLDGLAAALTDPEVAGAILAAPEAPVALAVYEWSGLGYQSVILDWATITGPAALDAAAARIAGHARRPAPQTTALGQAMLFGAELIARAPACWQATLDLSGDGKNNEGPRPRDLRRGAALAGITVNALVIGADAPRAGDRRQAEIAELSSYFRVEVIRGPGAFLETALGFEQYAAAMKRKLLRELAVLAVGALR